MNESELTQRVLQVGKEEGRQLIWEHLGRAARNALLAVALEEVEALCGLRYERGQETPCYRAGSVESHVYINGVPAKLKRPRVRRKQGDGSVEVFLKTWKTAQDPQQWEEAIMAATLCGVSTRDQKRLHAEELKGLSKSAMYACWLCWMAVMPSSRLCWSFSRMPSSSAALFTRSVI